MTNRLECSPSRVEPELDLERAIRCVMGTPIDNRLRPVLALRGGHSREEQ